MLETLAQNRTAVVGNLWVVLVVLDQRSEGVRRISTIPLVHIVTEVFDDWVEGGNVLTEVSDRGAIAEETVEESYNIFFGLCVLLAERAVGATVFQCLKVQPEEVLC